MPVRAITEAKCRACQSDNRGGMEVFLNRSVIFSTDFSLCKLYKVLDKSKLFSAG